MKVAIQSVLIIGIQLCSAIAMAETNFDADVWPNLLPDNEQFEDAVTNLKTLATVPSTRAALIAFVANQIRSRSLAVKKQIKLGMVVRALMQPTHTNDAAVVKGLVTQGRRFVSFYGESLVEVNPLYIEMSFDVFTNKTDLIAEQFNFETQGTEPYIVQDDVLQNLKNATKRDFGIDRDAWLDWWQKEGRSLIYDPETGEYGTPERK
jgi:hypothetical protein